MLTLWFFAFATAFLICAATWFFTWAIWIHAPQQAMGPSLSPPARRMAGPGAEDTEGPPWYGWAKRGTWLFMAASIITGYFALPRW